MTLGFSEPPKSASTTQEPSSAGDVSSSSDAPVCLNCSTEPIAYQAPGCKHPSLCKKCAMKQATGGKCKVCGEKFFELQRV